MSQSSFTSKQLRVTFVLSPANSNGTFPGTNSNTLIISGARMSCTIQTVPQVPTATNLKIYGMQQKDMNALTTIFFRSINVIQYNRITIEQNSTGKSNGWTQVFSGMITEAQPDYRGIPNAFFGIQAIVGYQFQITAVPPVSYRGTVPVDTIVRALADAMSLAYVNAGVTKSVTNFYGPGTYMDQLNRVCQQTQTQFVLTGDTLTIWPYGTYRANIPMLLLSPDTGLEGYPTLEKFGVTVESLFNPALDAGGRIQIADSDVPNANGIWTPFMVDHTLECNLPGGRWHTVAQCFPNPGATS